MKRDRWYPSSASHATRRRLRRSLSSPLGLIAGTLLLFVPDPCASQYGGPSAVWLASKGFQQRANAGAVLHMTQKDIFATGAGKLSELLRPVDGVRIRQLSSGGTELMLGSGSGEECAASMFLNGVPINLGELRAVGPGVDPLARRGLRIDDVVRLSWIEGLELYNAANNPVASDSRCGVLLLWSWQMQSEVDVPFTGRLRGRVIDQATGAPVVGARIVLQPGRHEIATDARGAFDIAALLPGEYSITGTRPGYAAWTEDLLIFAFATHDIELRLEPGERPLRLRPSLFLNPVRLPY